MYLWQFVQNLAIASEIRAQTLFSQRIMAHVTLIKD